MASIIPSPPGYSVAFTEAPARRFAEPAPYNVFAIGFADRGTVAQGAGVADLLAKFGARVNYSSLHDGLISTIVEAGGATWTLARVVGPDAVKASVVLDDADSDPAITVTAKSAGAWANGAATGLKAQVTAPAAETRRIIITEDGETVATSPATDDVTELVAWSDDNDYVDVTAAGTELPAVVAATNLAGGDDDRANATVTEYQAALDLLEKRYGPGILIAPGVTDDEVHAAILAHCATFNRVPMLDRPADETKNDAITYAQGLQADADEVVRHGGVFASWAYCTPIAGEPERLVPYSCLQAGIAVRVHRAIGVANPAFGPARGASRLAARLYREYSDADRSDLYAAGVNVATDDGATISSWGYRTLELADLHVDLHHQHVRMALRFDCEQVMAAFIGEPIDAKALASLNGRLEAVCKAYQADRALFGDDSDPGYLIDVDSVNTTETMQARQLHAAMRIRQTPTTDWADLSITVSGISQSI